MCRTARDYGYHLRVFCSCGWSTAPSFGDPFFVHERYCPCCGKYYPKDGLNYENSTESGWFKKVVKWVDGDIIKTPWYKFDKREPGHWEERNDIYM